MSSPVCCCSLTVYQTVDLMFWLCLCSFIQTVHLMMACFTGTDTYLVIMLRDNGN
uniref:Uncharacterized protein n=1 Tax=Anguilla anguilla TaxID=7936 RepID=A0A0E9QUP9_ANGAN